jgi:hypothetical protein
VGNVYWNRNIPQECHNRVVELKNAGHKLICVAFSPLGGNRWSLSTNKSWNGNWDNPVAGHGKGDPNGMQAFAFDFVRDADSNGVGDEGCWVPRVGDAFASNNG